MGSRRVGSNAGPSRTCTSWRECGNASDQLRSKKYGSKMQNEKAIGEIERNIRDQKSEIGGQRSEIHGVKSITP